MDHHHCTICFAIDRYFYKVAYKVEGVVCVHVHMHACICVSVCVCAHVCVLCMCAGSCVCVCVCTVSKQQGAVQCPHCLKWFRTKGGKVVNIDVYIPGS